MDIKISSSFSQFFELVNKDIILGLTMHSQISTRAETNIMNIRIRINKILTNECFKNEYIQ